MADRRLHCAGITEAGTDWQIAMIVQEYTIDSTKEVWKGVAGYTLTIPTSTAPGEILDQVKAGGLVAVEQYDREQAAQVLLNGALQGFTFS